MSQSLVTNSEIYSNESIHCNICRREEIAYLKQIIIIFVAPSFFAFAYCFIILKRDRNTGIIHRK